MNFIDQDLDDSWECPTCLQPFPPHHDYECGTCEAKASEHLRVTAMCRLLREVSGREAALIVERDKLKQQLSAERALADRLAEALRVAYGLITRHHEVGVTQELGCFCPVCHQDGKEPEMDQIIAVLAAWKEARSK